MSRRCPEALPSTTAGQRRHITYIHAYKRNTDMSKTPEMVELRKAVEEKYKKPLRTTTDFERFTHKMEKEYGEQISTATMKRLWDYVSDQHKPRESTGH